MADTSTPLVNLPELAAQVVQRLGTQIREFRLVATHHGIVLHGRAPSYYVKQLAQDVVMKGTTTPIAANEIGVNRTDP
jgi:hypothetical protein